jgi:hypothetical protein
MVHNLSEEEQKLNSEHYSLHVLVVVVVFENYSKEYIIYMYIYKRFEMCA